MKLSLSDVHLALAKQTPDPIVETTRFIPNPNVTWDQIGRLEYRPIRCSDPHADTRAHPVGNHAPRTGLQCSAGDQGHAEHPSGRHAELCHSLRGDRLYTEVEQNALLIPRYLWSDPNPLVVVDYGFYRANQGQLAGSALEGPEPFYTTIADGSYPLALAHLSLCGSSAHRSLARRFPRHEPSGIAEILQLGGWQLRQSSMTAKAESNDPAGCEIFPDPT